MVVELEGRDQWRTGTEERVLGIGVLVVRARREEIN